MYLSIRRTTGKERVGAGIWVECYGIHHPLVRPHPLIWLIGEVNIVPCCVARRVTDDKIIALWMDGETGRHTTRGLEPTLQAMGHEVVAPNGVCRR